MERLEQLPSGTAHEAHGWGRRDHARTLGPGVVRAKTAAAPAPEQPAWRGMPAQHGEWRRPRAGVRFSAWMAPKPATGEAAPATRTGVSHRVEDGFDPAIRPTYPPRRRQHAARPSRRCTTTTPADATPSRPLPLSLARRTVPLRKRAVADGAKENGACMRSQQGNGSEVKFLGSRRWCGRARRRCARGPSEKGQKPAPCAALRDATAPTRVRCHDSHVIGESGRFRRTAARHPQTLPRPCSGTSLAHGAALRWSAARAPREDGEAWSNPCAISMRKTPRLRAPWICLRWNDRGI